jgi:chromate reductase, NAD(P)H dehydrogenase (quinone)
MKITAFGASYSRTSINRQWAEYVSVQIPGDHSLRVLDLNDYDLPVYTVERQNEIGIPASVGQFVDELYAADLIVVSFAEYNGTYTAGFKNLFDWASRHQIKMFENKPMILLAAAPGPRGGATVLQTAVERFPRHGARVIGSMALPRFKETFNPEQGLVDPELRKELDALIASATAQI